MAEDKYRRLTYDLTLHFAQMVQNPDMTFCYVSGAGTDSTEKGRSMWARIKGKTENDLLAMPFKAAYMFRPGFIRPLKGVQSKTPAYAVLLMVFRPFFGLLESFPKYATTSVKLGKAMINAVTKGYDKPILESTDINLLGVQ